MTADGLTLDTDFITSPNVDEIILGRDWLSRHHVTWSFGDQHITLYGRKLPIVEKAANQTRCRRCIAKTDIDIPPRSEVTPPVHIVFGNLRQ